MSRGLTHDENGMMHDIRMKLEELCLKLESAKEAGMIVSFAITDNKLTQLSVTKSVSYDMLATGRDEASKKH